MFFDFGTHWILLLLDLRRFFFHCTYPEFKSVNDPTSFKYNKRKGKYYVFMLNQLSLNQRV